MSELFSARIKKLIDLEETVNGGVKNNKVANFSYTSNAYDNNEAAGTDNFNISRDNNIPNANPVAVETDRTVLDRGYRSQGASLSRMLMNHFLGRTSYNLNKIHDWFTDLLKIVSEMSVKGFWDLTKEVDASIDHTSFDSMIEPGTYKGVDFSRINSGSLPDWIAENTVDYGEWTLIVEQGYKFKRQFLYYTRSKNSAPEFGDYLAIRTFSQSESGDYSPGQWTSKAVDADHALVSDTLNEGATMGGKDVALKESVDNIINGTTKVDRATNADFAANLKPGAKLGNKDIALKESVDNIVNGTTKVGKATNADTADNLNTNAKIDGVFVTTVNSYTTKLKVPYGMEENNDFDEIPGERFAVSHTNKAVHSPDDRIKQWIRVDWGGSSNQIAQFAFAPGSGIFRMRYKYGIKFTDWLNVPTMSFNSGTGELTISL